MDITEDTAQKLVAAINRLAAAIENKGAVQYVVAYGGEGRAGWGRVGPVTYREEARKENK